ncbi:DUF1566 domain-containing protein [bacterium]|nr:DUF1566 domain-containing protein [bacterium]
MIRPPRRTAGSPAARADDRERRGERTAPGRSTPSASPRGHSHAGILLLALATLLLPAHAHAVPPSQKCASAKLVAASRFSACRLRAEATFRRSRQGPVESDERRAAQERCDDALVGAYGRAESRYGGECSRTGDVQSVRGFLGDGASRVAEGKPSSLLATGQTHDTGWGSDGHVKAGATRTFVDNGDGTVTDLRTGLTWEKKSGDDSIHAWDRTFTWCGDANPFDEICDVAGTPMDGTAVTDFIATLNAGNGFAGHTDWRIPNLEELESIRKVGAIGALAGFEAFDTGCAPGCTVTSCSCTRPAPYWTSSTYRAFPYDAWTVEFRGGSVEAFDKTGRHLLRAVRGGL